MLSGWCPEAVVSHGALAGHAMVGAVLPCVFERSDDIALPTGELTVCELFEEDGVFAHKLLIRGNIKT